MDASPRSEGDRTPASIDRVVLVGFMGSGKTSVGSILAARLGWEHVDLDREIEAREGRRIAEIFAAEGEAAFRRLEAAATREISTRTRVVLSPGGGWITRPELLEVLGDGTLSVWLQVSPEEAVRRAAAAPGERPLLAGPDPLAAARRLLAERERFYARADVVVSTAERTPEQVAEFIETEIRARGALPASPIR